MKQSGINNVKKVLKEIITCYINERNIYDIVVKEWIIALYDDGSSRRQGKSGENKIKQILEKKGYIFVENWGDFFNNKYSLAFISSNKGVFSSKNIKKELNIKYNFNSDKKKSSDVLVKKDNDFYIIEAKHLKGTGGNQNNQFKELLNLISYQESSENIHYVGFLDGIYWNFYLKSNSKYENTGKSRIELIKENLENNPNNYFVNTYGLKKLFSL